MSSERRESPFSEANDNPPLTHLDLLAGEETHSAPSNSAHAVFHSPTSNTAEAMSENFVPKICALLAKHQQQMVVLLSAFASVHFEPQSQSVPSFISLPESQQMQVHQTLFLARVHQTPSPLFLTRVHQTLFLARQWPQRSL